jgi:hypothetical protein
VLNQGLSPSLLEFAKNIEKHCIPVRHFHDFSNLSVQLVYQVSGWVVDDLCEAF